MKTLLSAMHCKPADPPPPAASLYWQAWTPRWASQRGGTAPCHGLQTPTVWWAAWPRSWRQRRAPARCGSGRLCGGEARAVRVECQEPELQRQKLVCVLRSMPCPHCARTPRCLQTVLEGDLVNLGVTSPAAALALGLMYLQVLLLLFVNSWGVWGWGS